MWFFFKIIHLYTKVAVLKQSKKWGDFSAVSKIVGIWKDKVLLMKLLPNI